MQAGDVAVKTARTAQRVARDPMLPYYAYRGAEALVGVLPQSVSYWLGDRAADALLATVPEPVRRPARQPSPRHPRASATGRSSTWCAATSATSRTAGWT